MWRNWCVSVGLMCRSIWMRPFTSETVVSKNMTLLADQFAVNLMMVWWWLRLSKEVRRDHSPWVHMAKVLQCTSTTAGLIIILSLCLRPWSANRSSNIQCKVVPQFICLQILLLFSYIRSNFSDVELKVGIHVVGGRNEESASFTSWCSSSMKSSFKRNRLKKLSSLSRVWWYFRWRSVGQKERSFNNKLDSSVVRGTPERLSTVDSCSGLLSKIFRGRSCSEALLSWFVSVVCCPISV